MKRPDYLDLRDLSTWLSVPEHPSDDIVRDAIRCIWHPFKEFPFESPVDRGGCFAALLTITVRPLLPTAPVNSIAHCRERENFTREGTIAVGRL